MGDVKMSEKMEEIMEKAKAIDTVNLEQKLRDKSEESEKLKDHISRLERILESENQSAKREATIKELITELASVNHSADCALDDFIKYLGAFIDDVSFNDLSQFSREITELM